MVAMHTWLLASRNTFAAGSGTAKAIKHALNRWHVLKRYASSGSMPIGNNAVENVIPSDRYRQEELAVRRFRTRRCRADVIQACSPPPS